MNEIAMGEVAVPRLSVLVPLLTGMLAFAANAGAMHDAADAPGDSYSVKPSDIVIPEGVPPGRYRRSFQPFGDWMLVCDENLHARQVVCNVSQTIIDASGHVIFSWSLAAAETGKPFLILRATPDMEVRSGFELLFSRMKAPRKVAVEGCSRSVCIGVVEVAPLVLQAIDRGEAVTVAYRRKEGSARRMHLPLKGLKEAVASIGGDQRSANGNARQQ